MQKWHKYWIFQTAFFVLLGVKRSCPDCISPLHLCLRWVTGYPEFCTRGDAADTTAASLRCFSPLQVSVSWWDHMTRLHLFWRCHFLNILELQIGAHRWSPSVSMPDTTGWMDAGVQILTDCWMQVMVVNLWRLSKVQSRGYLRVAALSSQRWAAWAR